MWCILFHKLLTITIIFPMPLFAAGFFLARLLFIRISSTREHWWLAIHSLRSSILLLWLLCRTSATVRILDNRRHYIFYTATCYWYVTKSKFTII
jgi:hypothetical protein